MPSKSIRRPDETLLKVSSENGSASCDDAILAYPERHPKTMMAQLDPRVDTIGCDLQDEAWAVGVVIRVRSISRVLFRQEIDVVGGAFVGNLNNAPPDVSTREYEFSGS
ncbi:MAG: hypothetical protein V3T49_02650 [Dehalococcoidia bacterium]